jgi:prepilin-type N-terminal cleavage/methylation domain-containing protein
MHATRNAECRIRNAGIHIRQSALRDGVTLLELLIVIMIIGLLTAAALKAYDTQLQAGRFEATARTLNELTAAIVGNPDLVTHGVRIDYGYVGDLGQLPGHLEDLVTRPAGLPDPTLWRGPYITNRLAENPQGYMIDAWGDSLDYAATDSIVTIASHRGMSILEPDSFITRRVGIPHDLLHNAVGGLVLDAKGNTPDTAFNRWLSISIVYPLLGHLIGDTLPAASITNGNFTFPPNVPIGNHTVTVRWIDTLPPAETTFVQKTVSVSPRGKSWLEIHLPVPFYP